MIQTLTGPFVVIPAAKSFFFLFFLTALVARLVSEAQMDAWTARAGLEFLIQPLMDLARLDGNS